MKSKAAVVLILAPLVFATTGCADPYESDAIISVTATVLDSNGDPLSDLADARFCGTAVPINGGIEQSDNICAQVTWNSNGSLSASITIPGAVTGNPAISSTTPLVDTNKFNPRIVVNSGTEGTTYSCSYAPGTATLGDQLSNFNQIATPSSGQQNPGVTSGASVPLTLICSVSATH